MGPRVLVQRLRALGKVVEIVVRVALGQRDLLLQGLALLDVAQDQAPIGSILEVVFLGRGSVVCKFLECTSGRSRYALEAAAVCRAP